MKKGIDISSHQGTIDFNKVKNAVEFVVLRGSYGERFDDKLMEYAAECNKYDIPIHGLYCFDYALSDAQAVAEADYLVGLAKQLKLPGTAVLYFDLEYDSVRWAKQNGVTLDPAACQRHTRLFCNRVRELGYTPGYYANLDYMKTMYTGFDDSDLKFWYARPESSTTEYPYLLWQYGTEFIPGISGQTDVNYMSEFDTSNSEKSSEGNFVKINPTEWINSHLGKIYDIDGVAGIQCVDLYKIFLKDIGYPNPTRPIGGDGYADYIWYNRDALGLSKYFDYVQGELKVGDIVIWAKNSPDCPSSHVAMYAGDAEGMNRGLIFGSNQGTPHSAGNIMVLSCDGAIGALRYKGYSTGPLDPLKKPTPIKDEGRYAVYRMYNPNSGEHIFTIHLAEANHLNRLGYEYEGVAWRSSDSGWSVYRFYNRSSGVHMYTSDMNEIRSLKKSGWEDEGIAFLSSGNNPVYRLYNPCNGMHHFTANSHEKAALVKYGWIDEGIGFYTIA